MIFCLLILAVLSKCALAEILSGPAFSLMAHWHMQPVKGNVPFPSVNRQKLGFSLSPLPDCGFSRHAVRVASSHIISN